MNPCDPFWLLGMTKNIAGLAAVSLEEDNSHKQNGNASSSAEVLTSDWTEGDDSSSQGKA